MKISLIIHTWDPYSDAWDPFFILLKNYWPNFEGSIYLNTENKDYSFDGLKVIPLKVGGDKNPNTIPLEWSERLEKGLERIDDEIILYMQEDYFLKDFVNDELLEKYYNLIKNNLEIDCIQLTDQGTPPLLTSKKRENLYLADPSNRYYMSGQTAFWRKSTLLKCLRSSESGWEFEEFGSKRAKYLNLNIYTPDRNFVKKDKNEIIPYIYTGIIRGQWHKDVPELFKKNNIKMDFSKRGFDTGKMKTSLLFKINHRIRHLILLITCLKDIFLIKYLKK